MAPPEVWLIETATFELHTYALSEELGPAAGPVLRRLGSAIQLLARPDVLSLPGVRPHGRRGDVFSYAFHPPYLLTFRRKTERDAGKRPTRIRLELLTIQKDERPAAARRSIRRRAR